MTDNWMNEPLLEQELADEATAALFTAIAVLFEAGATKATLAEGSQTGARIAFVREGAADVRILAGAIEIVVRRAAGPDAHDL